MDTYQTEHGWHGRSLALTASEAEAIGCLPHAVRETLLGFLEDDDSGDGRKKTLRELGFWVGPSDWDRVKPWVD